MLDKKTLEWLERRENLCTRCAVKNCIMPNNKNRILGGCEWFEVKAPGSKTGKLREDYRDAAEFEARVAASATWRGEVMLCVHCQYKKDGCKRSNRLHTRMESHWCKLKHHRLAVEREMIAESKGGGAGKAGGKWYERRQENTGCRDAFKACFREVNDEETCPVGGGDNCPFPDMMCEDITPEDWLEWMEATND